MSQSASKFPRRRELAISLRRGCRSFVSNREEELSQDEIKVSCRAERLRELIVLVQHAAATDETDAATASLPAAENEPGISNAEADTTEQEAEIAEGSQRVTISELNRLIRIRTFSERSQPNSLDLVLGERALIQPARIGFFSIRAVRPEVSLLKPPGVRRSILGNAFICGNGHS